MKFVKFSSNYLDESNFNVIMTLSEWRACGKKESSRAAAGSVVEIILFRSGWKKLWAGWDES